VIVPPTGPEVTVGITDTHTPTLENLQQAVGGYVEPVKVRYQGKIRQAYVDEDGLSKQLPPNPAATEMLAMSYFLSGQLRGNCAIWIPNAAPKMPEVPMA
jgi:hypothetical protein